MRPTTAAREFHQDPKIVNAIVGLLVRLGVLPHTYLLEVKGARSGRLRTTPVTLVEDGERWLVAPYGVRAWVRNVRANPAGRLLRGRGAAERPRSTRRPF